MDNSKLKINHLEKIMNRIFYVFVGLMLTFLAFSKEGEKNISVEFHLAEIAEANSLIKYTLPDSVTSIFLHKEAFMDNNHIKQAAVEMWQDKPAVRVSLSDDGKDIFAHITTNNVKKHVAILVDGKLVTAPMINAPITKGVAIINGDFTIEEAERIAARLNISVSEVK